MLRVNSFTPFRFSNEETQALTEEQPTLLRFFFSVLEGAYRGSVESNARLAKNMIRIYFNVVLHWKRGDAVAARRNAVLIRALLATLVVFCGKASHE